MKFFIWLSLLMTADSIAHAEDGVQSINFPSSPAASVLEISPNVVLAPKDYDALQAALFSSFTNGSGGNVLLDDFGMEAAPYWMEDHSLSLEDYLFPGIQEALLRNSSFSISSTRNFLTGDSTAIQAIGFGYRTGFPLWTGNYKDEIKKYKNGFSRTSKLYTSIASRFEELLDKAPSLEWFSDSLQNVVSYFLKQEGRGDDEIEKINKMLENALDEFDEKDFMKNRDGIIAKTSDVIAEGLEIEKTFTQFEEYIISKPGLYVNLAAATIVGFPTGGMKFSYVPKGSLWFMPTHSLDNFKFSGVLRWEWYNSDYYIRYFPGTEFYDNNFDYGIAFGYESEKFSAQMEIVGRRSRSVRILEETGNERVLAEKTKEDLQYVGTLSYRINEQIALTYNLGNRFDPVTNPGNTLVSLFSLNFGFGSPENIY